MPFLAAPIAGFLFSAGIGAGVAAAVGNAIVAVGGFLVTGAVSMAVNIGLSKLVKPKTPGAATLATQERQASVLQLSIGEQPRELIVGRAATGGTFVDGFNMGGDNGTDWEVLVIALADHFCEGLEGFWVNDVYVPFVTDGGVDGYAGQLTVYFRNGAAGEPDFPTEWQDKSPALAPGALQGVCKVVVGYKADAPDAENPIWSGRPSFLWQLKGARLYDPRLDDTVGGSGAHRWDDPSTWAWTENAEICRYAYQRGIYALNQVDQPDQLLIGRGLSALTAPPAAIFAAANLCDEMVDDGVDGTEPRYRVGGVIRSNQAFLEVEEMFAAAMAGEIIQPQGGVAVDPGAAKSIALSFTDADLVVGERVEFNAFGSDADRVNTVIARYIDPGQKWIETSAPVCRDLSDVAAEGPRDLTLSLSLVPYKGQACRIAEIRRRQARLERTARVVLGPAFAELEEGDWVEWTSDRHTGGQPVAFTVQSFALNAAWRNTLALRETDASVYGGAFNPEGQVPAEPSTPPDALQLTDVSAEAFQIEGSSGALIPAVRFHWATPVDAAVNRIRAEIRATGESAHAFGTTEAVGQGEWLITEGLGADRVVEVRLVPLGAPGRPITPSSWITLSIGALRSSVEATVTAAIAEAEAAIAALEAKAKALNADAEARIAELDRVAEGVMEMAMSGVVQAAYADYLARLNGAPVNQVVGAEQIRTDNVIANLEFAGIRNADGSARLLTVDKVEITEGGDSLAFHLTELSTATGAVAANLSANYYTKTSVDSAVAGATTTITAAYNAAISATATSILSTMSTADTAIANAVLGVSSTLNGSTTQVAITQTALATATGQLYGRMVLSTSAGGVATGIEIMSAFGPTALSAIRFKASAVEIYDDSNGNGVSPFYYNATDGWLFVDELRCRTANIMTANIVTLHLAHNSVTYPEQYNANVYVTLGGTLTDVSGGLGVPVDEASEVQLSLVAALDNSTGSAADVSLGIYCDGVLVDAFAQRVGADNTANLMSFFTGHGASAGTHSYTVKGSSSPSGVEVLRVTLKPTVLLR